MAPENSRPLIRAPGSSDSGIRQVARLGPSRGFFRSGSLRGRIKDMSTDIVPTLTSEEDTFCLAVIECGGNLAAAYRQSFGEAGNPSTRARLLIQRPEIAKRIQQLTVAVEEHALVSLGSHLVKLAEIRDLAIGTDQLKVALAAETKRGEAAGFYAGKVADKGSSGSSPSVVINIGKTPQDVTEWAARHGAKPVVVDV